MAGLGKKLLLSVVGSGLLVASLGGSADARPGRSGNSGGSGGSSGPKFSGSIGGRSFGGGSVGSGNSGNSGGSGGNVIRSFSGFRPGNGFGGGQGSGGTGSGKPSFQPKNFSGFGNRLGQGGNSSGPSTGGSNPIVPRIGQGQIGTPFGKIGGGSGNGSGSGSPATQQLPRSFQDLVKHRFTGSPSGGSGGQGGFGTQSGKSGQNNHQHHGHDHDHGHDHKHGHWHGWRGFGFAPIGWGYGGWGYGAGYWGRGWGVGVVGVPTYCNPYCCGQVNPTIGGYNYAVPIVPQGQTAPQDGQLPPAALQALEGARQTFLQADFAGTHRFLDQALAAAPKDINVHQFRSLVYFAQGQYPSAAAVAHAALASGPGWDWNTLRGLYPSVDVYTRHLRALEDAGKQNPEAPELRFLLAYHYLMCGHTDAARKQLDRLVQLEPRDELAMQLLKMVGGPLAPAAPIAPNALPPNGIPQAPAGPGAPQGLVLPVPGADPNLNPNPNPVPNPNVPAVPQPPVAPQPPAVPQPPVAVQIPVAPQVPQLPNLVGVWKARPAPNVTIELTLNADGSFAWKVDAEGQPSRFTGKHSLANDTLTLTRDQDGEKLIGSIAPNGPAGFVFRPQGTPANDPGLNFAP